MSNLKPEQSANGRLDTALSSLGYTDNCSPWDRYDLLAAVERFATSLSDSGLIAAVKEKQNSIDSEVEDKG